MMNTRAWAEFVFKINVALMILANVLWYWIKFINSDHGRTVNPLWHHGDIRHFTQVIEAETDPEKRRKYRAILWGLRISIVVIVLGMILGAVLVFRPGAPLRQKDDGHTRVHNAVKNRCVNSTPPRWDTGPMASDQPPPFRRPGTLPPGSPGILRFWPAA